jgi:hypothetical protein
LIEELISAVDRGDLREQFFEFRQSSTSAKLLM